MNPELQGVIDFFKVEDEKYLFDLTSRPNDDRFLKMALFGDAKLLFFVRKHLLKLFPDENVGFLTEMTKIFVANETMKVFLLLLAPNGQRLHQLSAHSVGTIFEAIFNLPTTTTEVFIMYYQKIYELLNPEKLVRAMHSSLDSVVEGEEFKQAIEKQISMHQFKLEMQQTIKVPKMLSLAAYVHKHQEHETLAHKEDAIVAVEWKSRKKHTYQEKFYLCCGTNLHPCSLTFSKECKRNTWIDRNSMHTGKLSIPHGARQGGGVGPRCSSYDHLPIANVAYWTCCGQESIAEGCKSLYKREEVSKSDVCFKTGRTKIFFDPIDSF